MSKVHEEAVVGVPPLDGVDSEAEERRVQIERNRGLIELLESWLADPDVEEQQESWEFLKQALDEDRLSDRKLFHETNNRFGQWNAWSRIEPTRLSRNSA